MDGCRNSERSQVTRRRVALVIDALARIQRTDLILPHTHDMGLAATLGAMAALIPACFRQHLSVD